MKVGNRIWLAGWAAIALIAGGCGGGGSSSDAEEPPAAASIAGTAASGAALANAPVVVSDGAGASPCEEAAITTTALGSYTCTLKAGASAPFFVVVTDPTGNVPPLVSVSTATPAAGAALTVNATPLTTAILAQLASDGNALTLVSGGTIDAANLKLVSDRVVAQLAPVLQAIDAPADYDPFATAITAATPESAGNTADLVLDVVRIVMDPATGRPALATTADPTPVVLATTDNAGATVAQPSAVVSSLSQGAQLAAQAFNDCFALPTAQRVLAKDASIVAAQGGPEVTSVASACERIAASAGNGAGVDYLHNGYRAGQQFYQMLTRDAMTGARFSVPEIMALYPKSASATAPDPRAYDRAVLNLRYLDSAGNSGNVITVAALLPNTASATRATDWWLVGNQDPVDVSIQASIRRVEQMNPANTFKFSTYQNGVIISIGAKGPGSVRGAGTLVAARVSGPGLPGDGAPGTGVVLKVSSQASQGNMDLFNKTGDLAVGAQCGNGVVFNCPNLWFERTQGLTGTAAGTLAANPDGGTNALIWKHAGDGMDPAKFVKGAKYRFELFYGSETTASVVITRSLLSDVVPAVLGVNLPWNKAGTQTLAALDPAGSLAGEQSALTVDWVQDLRAQQVGQVRPVVNATTGSYGSPKAPAPGETSVVLDNNVVPAFTATTTRTFLLSYRMHDGSNKTHAFTYN